MAVVYHPGRVDSSRITRAVESAGRRFGWRQAAWFPTTAQDGGREAIRSALETDPKLLLCVGGDGTVRDVAAGLVGTDVPVGVVPAGSTNLFATGLGIRRSGYAAALRALATGDVVPVGSSTVSLSGSGEPTTHRYFVQAGFGISEGMVQGTRSHHKRVLRWMAYVPAIMRSIGSGTSRIVTYDDQAGNRVSHAAHSMFAGTCGRLPTGINILPDADPRSTEMRTLLLSPITPATGAQIAGWLLRTNRSPGTAMVKQPREALCYVAGTSLTIDVDRPTAFQADGDPIGCATRAAFAYSSGSVNFVVPRAGRRVPGHSAP